MSGVYRILSRDSLPHAPPPPRNRLMSPAATPPPGVLTPAPTPETYVEGRGALCLRRITEKPAMAFERNPGAWFHACSGGAQSL